MTSALDLTSQWATWMRAGGVRPGTIELRTRYLRVLTRSHPELLEVTLEDLLTWVANPAWSANTKRSARASARSFYRWTVLAGHLQKSPAEALPQVRLPRAQARPVDEAGYRQALAAADDRERLAILLAAQCGLRRGEIARARREDIEQDLLGSVLRVTGKGGHVRLVPLPDALAATMSQQAPGWFFPSPVGTGHLTPHHLGKIVSRLLPQGYTTHSLRHRCATTAYAATRDLRAVQDLLGHSKPETTANYVVTPKDGVRAAVAAAAA